MINPIISHNRITKSKKCIMMVKATVVHNHNCNDKFNNFGAIIVNFTILCPCKLWLYLWSSLRSSPRPSLDKLLRKSTRCIARCRYSTQRRWVRMWYKHWTSKERTTLNSTKWSKANCKVFWKCSLPQMRSIIQSFPTPSLSPSASILVT